MSAPAGDGGICVAAGQPATWNDPNLLPGTEPACAVVGAGESYTALNTNRIVGKSDPGLGVHDRSTLKLMLPSDLSGFGQLCGQNFMRKRVSRLLFYIYLFVDVVISFR